MLRKKVFFWKKKKQKKFLQMFPIWSNITSNYFRKETVYFFFNLLLLVTIPQFIFRHVNYFEYTMQKHSNFIWNGDLEQSITRSKITHLEYLLIVLVPVVTWSWYRSVAFFFDEKFSFLKHNNKLLLACKLNFVFLCVSVFKLILIILTNENDNWRKWNRL